MRPVSRSVLVLTLVGLASASGCDGGVPPAGPGNVISGKVSYAGTALAGMRRPALAVVATATFPPSGPPLATATFVPTGLPGTVAYELTRVPAGPYRVVAGLFDLEPAAAGAATAAPTGAYPSLCAALLSPAALVTSLDYAQVRGIDITIYDRGADPCFTRPRPDAGVAAPDAGEAPPDAGAPAAEADGPEAAVRDAPLVETDAG